MKKKILIIASIVMIVILGIVLFIGYCILDSREKITNIEKYEKYLGENGKYKSHYGTYNDIFPNTIPENAEVEDFIYYYYNPWDANYLGYLVYTCDQDTFESEYNRLKSLSSSKDINIYGTTQFPYDLCAVYADEYYGYIYALADGENLRFIYVELQFANHFSDIKYADYIPEKYLPNGFDATGKSYSK